MEMDKERIERNEGGGGWGSSARLRVWLGMDRNTIGLLKHLKWKI